MTAKKEIKRYHSTLLDRPCIPHHCRDWQHTYRAPLRDYQQRRTHSSGANIVIAPLHAHWPTLQARSRLIEKLLFQRLDPLFTSFVSKLFLSPWTISPNLEYRTRLTETLVVIPYTLLDLISLHDQHRQRYNTRNDSACKHDTQRPIIDT